MGKFKFIFLLILALFLVCGIVMVVDAPSSFDGSLSLMPVSDSIQSNCENGSCLDYGDSSACGNGNCLVDADSSACNNNGCLVDSSAAGASLDSASSAAGASLDSNKTSLSNESHVDEMDYDSKYYEGSYIDGLYFCNDLDKAFKDAKAHHRNVMIVFDGAACIYCEYLKDDTLTDSAVQKEINDNYIILITETSESPELTSQLNIYGTPTTVIFDENGKELGRIEDYEPPEEYLAHLKDISGK